MVGAGAPGRHRRTLSPRHPRARRLGIGLSIAHYLVTRHGGTISAHSDGPGHGSPIRVVLPPADAQ